MSYKLYDVEDFASDATFRKWVLNPDEESNYFWERWIISNPEKKHDIEKAILIVKAISFEEVNFKGNEKQRLYKRIENTVHSKELTNDTIGSTHIYPINAPHPSSSSSNFFSRSIFYRIASILIGTLIIAYAVIYLQNKEENPVQSEPIISLIEKEIFKGQKMTIYLPDGSIVNLNSSSKITYPEKFSGDTREVELTGEAFFEVAKDSLRPFIVKSDGLTTNVLGTSFNIRSYPDMDIISVSLVTGKVLINSPGEEPVTLAPGESAGLNRKTGEIAISMFDYKKDIAWKDGVLFFQETRIQEVFKKLEQWYGVTIITKNIPSGIKPINGSFNDEYLNNVLLSLGHAVNFDYKINGNEVYVQFK